MEISRAAYYKWLNRSVPKQEQENSKLAELIKEYDERFCHILGYRRMTSWINHFNHTNYSRNRIHRIMKKLGIHSVIRKKKKTYRSSQPEAVAENKLKRDFNAGKPNEKWVTDVTEFKIPETGKKLYLSAIFDLYDRYPVAYVISRRNDNKLVFDTTLKLILIVLEMPNILHYSQTTPFAVNLCKSVEYHTFLHHSQTVHHHQREYMAFEYHTFLHHSQTSNLKTKCHHKHKMHISYPNIKA